MHIGVVEDNLAVLTMVETALTLHGYTVETYSESSSFLSSLQTSERIPPYDLVIVDYFLDEGSGIDIVEAIQAAQPRGIPAILISAAEESMLGTIRERYPDLPILQKPFKMRTLISLVNEIIP